MFKELWKLKVPFKIACFAWRLIKDRLPIRVNLRRRQIKLTNVFCPFCGSSEESASHLFFQCSKILPLWWESWSWGQLVGAFPQQPRQHFLHHIGGLLQGRKANRWKWWWLGLTWTIWKQRNSIIFFNDSFNANKMMDDAIFLLWTWLRHLEKGFDVHYNQWSTNLREGFLSS